MPSFEENTKSFSSPILAEEERRHQAPLWETDAMRDTSQPNCMCINGCKWDCQPVDNKSIAFICLTITCENVNYLHSTYIKLPFRWTQPKTSNEMTDLWGPIINSLLFSLSIKQMIYFFLLLRRARPMFPHQRNQVVSTRISILHTPSHLIRHITHDNEQRQWLQPKQSTPSQSILQLKELFLVSLFSILMQWLSYGFEHIPHKGWFGRCFAAVCCLLIKTDSCCCCCCLSCWSLELLLWLWQRSGTTLLLVVVVAVVVHDAQLCVFLLEETWSFCASPIVNRVLWVMRWTTFW